MQMILQITVTLTVFQKTVNVKPDSELIINFTTMQTNSKQGATNLVIKDAKKNTELATVNVAKTGTATLI